MLQLTFRVMPSAPKKAFPAAPFPRQCCCGFVAMLPHHPAGCSVRRRCIFLAVNLLSESLEAQSSWPWLTTASSSSPCSMRFQIFPEIPVSQGAVLGPCSQPTRCWGFIPVVLSRSLCSHYYPKQWGRAALLCLP